MTKVRLNKYRIYVELRACQTLRGVLLAFMDIIAHYPVSCASHENSETS